MPLSFLFIKDLGGTKADRPSVDACCERQATLDKAVDLPLFLAVPGDIFFARCYGKTKACIIAVFQMFEVRSSLSKNSGGTAMEQRA